MDGRFFRNDCFADEFFSNSTAGAEAMLSELSKAEKSHFSLRKSSISSNECKIGPVDPPLQARKSSVLSSRAFAEMFVQRVGGRPRVLMASYGNQSATALVQRVSAKGITRPTHLIFDHLDDTIASLVLESRRTSELQRPPPLGGSCHSEHCPLIGCCITFVHIWFYLEFLENTLGNSLDVSEVA